MDRAIFSSSDLPPQLDEKAKFMRWQDIHNENLGSFECKRPDNLPFSARIEAKAVGTIALWQMAGTISHASRLSRNIAEDSRDDYYMLINKTEALCTGSNGERQYDLGHGDAVILSAEDTMRLSGGASNAWANIVIPRALMTTAFGSIEDSLARSIHSGNEALGLLGRYIGFLGSGPALVSPALAAHASETIIDLVGLALGARGEEARIANLRGLRAARLHAILVRIRSDFSDPEISAQRVARSLGLSPGYVHGLLQETGSSFSEHVLELRLQKAARMLSDRSRDSMRISGIAYSVGFGDISYFNRCFRRRFGCSPGDMR